MSVRRAHMDCERDKCLLGDRSPCALFQPQFPRVRANNTPNDRYHAHKGDLIRYLYELDGTLCAEVRWDEPPPVEGNNRQVIRVEYLTSLDGNPLTPNLIEEEP